MELNLLEKNELRIENLNLNKANLNRIADKMADVLGIEREKVVVVDVRENYIAVDILKKTIEAGKIFGKKAKLLAGLAEIEGVEVSKETEIHSRGILGNIEVDEETAQKTIINTQKMADEIKLKLAQRVKVFPTGFEVARNMIEDTNSPLIKDVLSKEGYKVSIGSILEDDAERIAVQIRRTINEGYGLIITTGGVGAEGKDQTIEGICKVVPEVYTPYIVYFKRGEGRHKKDGVRVAVGKTGHTLVVALPGPNDEVKLALKVLRNELQNSSLQPENLAQKIAGVLRKKLKKKMGRHH